MEWKEEILKQLDLGFTKKDLETLIGLPANNLGSVLEGKRNFSKKNELRIERWLAMEEKPDPLTLPVSNLIAAKKAQEAVRAKGMLSDEHSAVKEIKATGLPKNEPKPPSGNRPSNLAELKAMCPFVDGDERRVWIATERQKYGV